MSTGAATDRGVSQTRSVTGQRWMARGAFAGIVAAVLVLVVSEGPIGLTLLVVGLLGTVVILSAGSGSSPNTARSVGSGWRSRCLRWRSWW